MTDVNRKLVKLKKKTKRNGTHKLTWRHTNIHTDINRTQVEKYKRNAQTL